MHSRSCSVLWIGQKSDFRWLSQPFRFPEPFSPSDSDQNRISQCFNSINARKSPYGEKIDSNERKHINTRTWVTLTP